MHTIYVLSTLACARSMATPLYSESAKATAKIESEQHYEELKR